MHFAYDKKHKHLCTNKMNSYHVTIGCILQLEGYDAGNQTYREAMVVAKGLIPFISIQLPPEISHKELQYDDISLVTDSNTNVNFNYRMWIAMDKVQAMSKDAAAEEALKTIEQSLIIKIDWPVNMQVLECNIGLEILSTNCN